HAQKSKKSMEARGIREESRWEEPGGGPAGQKGWAGASQKARGQTSHRDRPEGRGGAVAKTEKVTAVSAAASTDGSRRVGRRRRHRPDRDGCAPNAGPATTIAVRSTTPAPPNSPRSIRRGRRADGGY